MRTMSISTPSPQKKNYEKISHFRGINLQADSTLIDNNSASNMLNMQLDSVGTLQRFLGYVRVLDLGEEPVNGFYNYKSKILVSQNGNLFEFEEGEI